MTIDELIKALQALTYRTRAHAAHHVYFVDADGIAFNLDRVSFDDDEGDVRITSVSE